MNLKEKRARWNKWKELHEKRTDQDVLLLHGLFLDMHDVDLLYSYHLKRRILLMTSCKIGIQAC